jgi:hypothetical protein
MRVLSARRIANRSVIKFYLTPSFAAGTEKWDPSLR